MTALATVTDLRPAGELAVVTDAALGISVSVTTELQHRCPHKPEVDHGTVTITWPVDGWTLELHALGSYLRQWTDVAISHEELTSTIHRDIAAAGITATVVSRWVTAGIDVTVTAPGEAA